MIEEAIYSLLTGDAGIAAVVSTRVYPVTLPQNAVLPAIAFTRISTSRALTHDGSTQIAESSFQISCFHTNVKSAKTLAGLVRAKLHGYKGTVGSDVIQVTEVVDEGPDIWEPDLEEYQIPLEVVFSHKES
ncbi:conserved hypothetical protein [Gammaproteobacteria bacterium]